MKSKYALILAIGLGLAGAMLNYSYLVKKSQSVAMVDFVGIDREVKPGTLLTRDDLVPVPIPKDQMGTLDEFAVRYQSLETVLNKPAPRLLEPGTLLLEHDLATPPAQLEAGRERAGIADSHRHAGADSVADQSGRSGLVPRHADAGRVSGDGRRRVHAR